MPRTERFPDSNNYNNFNEKQAESTSKSGRFSFFRKKIKTSVPQVPFHPSLSSAKIEHRKVQVHQASNPADFLKSSQRQYINNLKQIESRLSHVETSARHETDFLDKLEASLSVFNDKHHTMLTKKDITNYKSLIHKLLQNAENIEKDSLVNFDSLSKQLILQKDDFVKYLIDYEKTGIFVAQFLDEFNLSLPPSERFFSVKSSSEQLFHSPAGQLERYPTLMQEMEHPDSYFMKSTVKEIMQRVDEKHDESLTELSNKYATSVQHEFKPTIGTLYTSTVSTTRILFNYINQYETNADVKNKVNKALEEFNKDRQDKLSIDDIKKIEEHFSHSLLFLNELNTILEDDNFAEKLGDLISKLSENTQLIAESIYLSDKMNRVADFLRKNGTVIDHHKLSEINPVLVHTASLVTNPTSNNYVYHAITEAQDRFGNIGADIARKNREYENREKMREYEDLIFGLTENNESISNNWDEIISTFNDIQNNSLYKVYPEFRNKINSHIANAYLQNLKNFARTKKYLVDNSLHQMRSDFKKDSSSAEAFGKSIAVQLQFLRDFDEHSQEKPLLSENLERIVREKSNYVLRK